METGTLEFLWKLGPLFVESTPHTVELGIEFVSIDIGRATLRLPYSHRLSGNTQTRIIHGGAVTTLLDQTSGLAAVSAFNPASAVVTLNFSIDYMRAAEPGKTIIGQASCRKATRNIAFIRGVAHDGDEDDPIAISQATFMHIGNMTKIAPDIASGVNSSVEAEPKKG